MKHNIKRELADDGGPPSSPTMPNTSSRAQTISSAAQTPTPTLADTQTQTATQGAHEDFDPPMSGVENHEGQDALHFLGADSHRLIQVIKKLEEFNIPATLQSLPKFVVVGDQSAGKSSIVEALCDISLPRSQGTCTRCPFLITTSSRSSSQGPAWTCTIAIKQGYGYQNGRFLSLNQPIATHFASVTEKADLEPMLRRAQLAILNPRQNPQTFVAMDLTSISMSREVAFTPNIISLEIQGLHLPEMSFYDLPGSINVVEDGEDPSLVNMIKQLVISYLKDENCLILLACGADQDVETSTTFKYIKDCNATQRCVGVLTKADLLPSGKAPYIQHILEGKKFALAKGWFITKQLSQAQIDMGISYVEAREAEANFFGNKPWVDLDNLQHRYGTTKLQEVVSSSLTDHIREELPRILDRVATRLQEVSEQLALFPERPTLPSFTVFNEIQKVASTLTSYSKGDDGFNALQKAIEAILTDFKKHIADLKPEVDYKTPGYQAPPISLDSDDEPQTPTPRTQLPPRASATPGSSSRKRRAQPTPQYRRVKLDPDGAAINKQTYTLDYLRHEYEQGNTSGVPGSTNPKVTDRLILQALGSWDSPVKQLLLKTGDGLRNTVLDVISKDLSTRRSTALFAQTNEILHGFVARLLQEAETRLNYLLSCEQERPITYSRWTAIRNSRVRELEQVRRNQRANEHFDTKEATSRTATPTAKRMEKAKDPAWYQPNLGDDDYANEIVCAATILTYYDTAAMCFVDTIAKHLEFGVLRPLRTDVAQTLFAGLNAREADVCAELLAEDPAREMQRIELMAEQGKLEKAMAELRELQA